MIFSVKSFTTDSVAFQQAFFIRQTVFVQEQQVPLREELDEFESVSRHYLVFVDDKPCGTGRWRETTKGIKVERIAVLREHRHQGIGSYVMRAILADIALGHPRANVYLHAQAVIRSFYESFGFVPEGEPFEESNIKHFYMYKPIE